LKAIGLKRISMTSNGHYLKDYAQALKQAGLDDLNISLDSLDPKQFQQLTQKQLQPVLQGISAAQQAGLTVKINSVLIKGINDNQIIPLVKWAQHQAIELRFIEFMPLDGDQKWNPSDVISEQDILDQLKTEFDVQVSQGQGANPARGYLVNGQPLGIISTITHSFCSDCDRLRLNAQGEFYNCLFARQGLNLKADIEQLALDHFATQTFQHKLHAYIWHKEAGFHAIQQSPIQKPIRKISMHSIGG
jgi:cyclic pyranopterin phosphate synthase